MPQNQGFGWFAGRVSSETQPRFIPIPKSATENPDSGDPCTREFDGSAGSREFGWTEGVGCDNRSFSLALLGWLANCAELSEELASRGHRIQSQSAAELMVHAYEEWGERCVERFWGEFVIALWDVRNRTLLLARDRIGHKLLFYHKSAHGIAFATHLQSLFEVTALPRTIDPNAIDLYLTFRAIPAPRSIYKDVNKLPAAHTLCFRKGRCTLRRYWAVTTGNNAHFSDDEAAERFRTLLSDVVRRQIDGRSCGIMLSGGLDSTIIFSLTVENAVDLPQRFSYAFSDTHELERARAIAAHLGVTGHEFRIEPRITEILPYVVKSYDEPYGNGSALPTYYFAKTLRRRVQVVLSGDGADEVFAGHTRQRAYVIADKLFALRHRTGMGGVCDLLSRISPNAQLRVFFQGVSLAAAQRHLWWTETFSRKAKVELYTEEFLEQVDLENSTQVIEALIRPHLQPLDQVLNLDLGLWVSEVMLELVRSGFGAAGVELRTPFLDHRVVEFAGSLPPRLKATWRNGKVLPRMAFSDKLPRSLPRQKKVGPKIPLAQLLRGELSPWLREYLLSKQALQRGYFQLASLKRMVDEHSLGHADHGQKLWALLMLELWMQRDCKGQVAERALI